MATHGGVGSNQYQAKPGGENGRTEEQGQSRAAVAVAASGQGPRFPLGRVVATPGALAALESRGLDPSTLVARHHNGDWGDLDDADKDENEYSVDQRLRIFSAYKVEGQKFYVITEADRSATTILLPSEY